MRLVIELDGAVHDDQLLYDLERTERLEACGWHVLRFRNELMMTDPGAVLDAISAEVRLARPQSLTLPRLRRGPLPLPPGRG